MLSKWRILSCHVTILLMQDDIGSLLHKVSKSLDKTSDQVLMERLGIGLSQFRVLLYLLGDDGCSQKLVAENLSQTEPSISRQARLLSEKGLIVVRRNTASRRERLLFLTQKGARTAEKAVNILNEYHAPMFDRISRQEQQRLIETLQAMQGYLK